MLSLGTLHWGLKSARDLCLGTRAGVGHAKSAPLLFPHVPEWGGLGAAPFSAARREVRMRECACARARRGAGAALPGVEGHVGAKRRAIGHGRRMQGSLWSAPSGGLLLRHAEPAARGRAAWRDLTPRTGGLRAPVGPTHVLCQPHVWAPGVGHIRYMPHTCCDVKPYAVKVHRGDELLLHCARVSTVSWSTEAIKTVDEQAEGDGSAEDREIFIAATILRKNPATLGMPSVCGCAPCVAISWKRRAMMLRREGLVT